MCNGAMGGMPQQQRGGMGQFQNRNMGYQPQNYGQQRFQPQGFGRQQFQPQGYGQPPGTSGYSPAPQRQMPTYQSQGDLMRTGGNPMETGGGSPLPAGVRDPSLAGTGGYSPAPQQPIMSKPMYQTGGMDPRPQGQPIASPASAFGFGGMTQGQPQNSGLHPFMPPMGSQPVRYNDPFQGDRSGMTGISNPGAGGNPVAPQGGGGGGMRPQITELQNSGYHPYQGGPQQPAAPAPFDPYKQFAMGNGSSDIPGAGGSFGTSGGFGEPTRGAGMTGIQNPGAGGGLFAPQGGGGGGMMPQATDLSLQGKAGGAPQGNPSWTGTGDINNIGPNGFEEFIYNPSQYGKAVNGNMRFSSGMTNPSQGLGGNMWLTDASGKTIAGDPNKAGGYAHGLGGLQASGLQAGQRYKLNYAGMPTSSRLSGNY